MLSTTEGIVLHFVKYGESSVIATIYTRESGRQSFMINAARSKKSVNKAGLLQPLFLVDMVAFQKQNREIHRVKELRTSYSYQNIPFDITKSTQAIFLAEILYKTINEQESFPEMYDFMKNALLYFDLMEKGSAGFHLWFLFRLTEYFGFLPDTTQKTAEGWFDLRKGAVVAREPAHPMFMDKEMTTCFCTLANLKINELGGFAVSRKVREMLLSKMMDYYHLHFENLSEIKSLKILKELFR